MKNNFEKLIDRLTPTIRRISHRLNGHFTFFNNDDLCQEALTHLWVMFQRGILDDKTDSYILQGCYFHLKNYIRTAVDKAKIQSIESPVDEDGTILEELIASHGASQEDQLEYKMLYEEIQKSCIDERDLSIVNMCMEGLTMREIGKKLGISHVAIVKLKKRIREKCANLEKEIKEWGGYQN